ncbi:CotH family protein [Carboxylicivirga marina]|uniref:Uncharacterized protein n=1 Tax=Carboxylicivirga marina TaxID=2800988 RepID=A0ABS1HNP9_9BACT|nr:hypothetical protein [Carboxylicivirga marina]MBK3519221.1 hypothetical protein [Carboxylicivirga marina]
MMRLSFFLLGLFIANSILANSLELDAATKQRIKQSAISFFEQEDIIEITVEADFSSLKEDRDRTKNDYHPAKVIVKDGSDDIAVLASIKTRGNFRLKSENCDFPPLRFKFKTRNVINTPFEGQKKLKLVTHCRDTSETMQQTMLREYLVYKMYNEVSDKSLRVRLVKANYVDVTCGDVLTKYAFFVESVEQMAERVGLEEVEMANLKQSQLVEENIVSLALFNYMIGNTDWSVPKLHNVALFRSDRHAPPVAVPYDFDMSEFVDACYMHVYMGRELLENRYKGKKVPMETLSSAMAHYQDIKEELVNTILSFEPLDLNARQECIKIVDSFYQVVNDRQASRKAFIAEATK